MTLTAPPGVFDILPEASEEWRSSYLWQFVEKVARDTAALFGFSEIRTPLFEREELFHRGVGDTTDVVSKEMYTFTDRGDRKMALRPEGTAPAIRAYIEHRLDQKPAQQKLFYLSSMFRYERSQAGRYRQHHQFGVESLGSSSALQDVEIIALLLTFYERLGLKKPLLYINTLGNPESRHTYREALVNYLQKYQTELSPDSQRRLTTNPLRILDSKDSNDQKILEHAPVLSSFLSSSCQQHFGLVCQLLQDLHIDYETNPKLVRGLDYYNGVVFEAVSDALGAQNSIGGGGRYDGLVKKLGGPDIPSCGFGTGLERVIQTLLAQNAPKNKPKGPLLYFIPLGETAQRMCFQWVQQLRQKNYSAQMEMHSRKLSKAMQYANEIMACYTVVVGDNELESKVFPIKNMETGQTDSVSFEQLEEYLRK